MGGRVGMTELLILFVLHPRYIPAIAILSSYCNCFFFHKDGTTMMMPVLSFFLSRLSVEGSRCYSFRLKFFFGLLVDGENGQLRSLSLSSVFPRSTSWQGCEFQAAAIIDRSVRWWVGGSPPSVVHLLQPNVFRRRRRL